MWSVYFGTADVDGDLKRAADMGATVVVDPTDVPGSGRLAMLLHPRAPTSESTTPEPGEPLGDAPSGASDGAQRSTSSWVSMVPSSLRWKRGKLRVAST